MSSRVRFKRNLAETVALTIAAMAPFAQPTPGQTTPAPASPSIGSKFEVASVKDRVERPSEN